MTPGQVLQVTGGTKVEWSWPSKRDTQVSLAQSRVGKGQDILEVGALDR